MFNAIVATAFQNVHEAHEVRIDISVRVTERIADASLSSEMDNALGSVYLEQTLNGIAVGKVASNELKPVARPKIV
jgi:hypothetical protein